MYRGIFLSVGISRLEAGELFLGKRGNLPCNALPQEVSTSEDGAFVRVSGHVNTTVSSETVSYKVAHYLCDALQPSTAEASAFVRMPFSLPQTSQGFALLNEFCTQAKGLRTKLALTFPSTA